MANKTALKEMVRDILKDELYSLLEDVRYRLTLLDSAENGRLLMPVSVRLNHAVADGYLTALVFRLLQREIDAFCADGREEEPYV